MEEIIRINGLTEEQIIAAGKEEWRAQIEYCILRKAIEQLINEGYIDTEKSELNKSADIYFPVITTKLSGEVEKYAVFDQSPPKTDSLRINVKNPSLFPRKNYMVSKIESVLQVETGTLVTNDINVEELVDKY